MWPCNNLRTSPPIRYPWIKGENRVHFSKHSNMYNYSSICNKSYRVDFSFFCLKFYIIVFKKSQKGKVSHTLWSQLNIAKWEKLQVSSLGRMDQDKEKPQARDPTKLPQLRKRLSQPKQGIKYSSPRLQQKKRETLPSYLLTFHFI